MKKKYCKFGIIIGAIFILLGLLTLVGIFGGDTNGASSAPYTYDSGYASFGADFYTYVTNNAEEAASASRTIASNLNEIATLLKNVLGFGMIAFGLLCICAFKIIMSSCENNEPIIEQPTTSDAPIQSTVVEETSQNDESPTVEEVVTSQES